jgi:hypothetical protein
MKVITKLKTVIQNLRLYHWSNQPKVLLGRWTIDYCENKINKKIDLSNEDHCGTCNNNNKPIDINKIVFFETM